MAKTRVRRATAPTEPAGAAHAMPHEPLSPEKVHALFGLPGPYDPPPAPMSLVGYATFWDPGVSIQQFHEKHRSLFYSTDWLGSARFARETDAWRWRQIPLAPIEAGLTVLEQEER